MSKFRREEDEADLWLREHDPYYTDPKRNKREKIKYPYETPEQERRGRETEIAFSCLSLKQMQEIGGRITKDVKTGKLKFEL